MKKITQFGHQGDLSFRRVDKVPKGFTQIDMVKEYDEQRGGYTLALGEHSGHAHTIVADRNDSRIKLYKDAQNRWCLEILEEVKLVHGTFIAPAKINESETDKHDTITFAPAIYVQGFEEAYDPFLKAVRRVQD